jgi:hypothetical protein
MIYTSKSSKLTIKDKLILIEYKMEQDRRNYSGSYIARKLGISIKLLKKLVHDLRRERIFTKSQAFSSTKLTSKGIRLAKGLLIADVILYIFENNFRKGITKTPKSEKDVQDAIEFMLAILDMPYEREVETVPTSTKHTIPDFTFLDRNLALEVKFCTNKMKEKRLIDEINADITSYYDKYKKLIFVVYDISTIRDRKKFEKGFENRNEDVYVVVVKH